MKLYFKYLIFLYIFLLAGAQSLLSQLDSVNISLPVSVESVMPSSFKGVKPDIILDTTNSLFPLFNKLMELRNPAATEKPVVRIVQIGDSHVRSHEFTPALNSRLIENFGNAAVGSIDGYRSDGIMQENGSPGVISHCIGINGATSQNFIDENYLTGIQKLQPDLIIISLGTNESIGNYNSSNHYDMMDSLFSALKNYCPNTPLLYTTPPGAFKVKYRKYRKHRRVHYRVVSTQENLNMKRVTTTIKQFADNHQSACWDLYNIVGGAQYACKNWLKGGYFQRDRVHFISAGYALQGALLYEALINGYNEYVTNKHE